MRQKEKPDGQLCVSLQRNGGDQASETFVRVKAFCPISIHL